MRREMNLISIIRPVTLILVIAIQMASMEREIPLMAVLTVGAAYFAASSAIIVGWIPAPPRWGAWLLWGEITAAFALNWATADQTPGGPMQVLYFPLAVTIFLILDRSQWRAATTSLAIAWLVGLLRDARGLDLLVPLANFSLYGVLLLFTSGFGLLLRNLSDEKARSEQLLGEVTESRAALERAHRQLRESVAGLQAAAVLEERQRLAREIHDSVAHSLTALVVQIQVGRRLSDRAPEERAARLARCEETAREALLETRRAVRALHPAGLEQQTDLEALRRLGRDFAVATGVVVEVGADGGAGALPPDPVRLEQLYRIFQEALTNAHRHGKAQRVEAGLAYDGDALRFTICSDGMPPSSLEPGIGLTSMADRARSLGGRLALSPGARGLTVTVTVPVRQGAPR